MKKIKLFIVGACTVGMLLNTSVAFAAANTNQVNSGSSIYNIIDDNTNLYKETDMDYTKVNFIKYPWLLKEVYENDDVMKHYIMSYMSVYRLSDDMIPSSVNKSMKDIVKILKFPNGQIVRDVLGDKKSLKSYTYYIAITQGPSEDKPCIARMYYVEYGPDQNGELKPAIKYVTLTADPKDIQKLPNSR